MLLWDFQKVMKMRGIKKYYSYLKDIGFTHTKAHNIGSNKVDKLSMDDLEKLCENLKCLPHDFIVWKPRKAQVDDENHPLRPLLPDKNGTSARNLLNKLTMDEIRNLEELVKKMRGKGKEEED